MARCPWTPIEANADRWAFSALAGEVCASVPFGPLDSAAVTGPVLLDLASGELDLASGELDLASGELDLASGELGLAAGEP
jgi:hypothetical protein